MTKQEIMRDIKQEFGTFVTITDIARYMNSGRDAARDLVAGLDYLDKGRSKQFFAGDVADRILKQRTM